MTTRAADRASGTPTGPSAAPTGPSAEDPIVWLLAPVLGAYILYATIDWEVPAPHWIRFGPLWILLSLAVSAGLRVVRGRLEPTAALAAMSISGMVLTDITLFNSQALRDFHLYLKAGDHYLEGTSVYLTGLVTQRPADLTNYPFLYPPLTLPFFALLDALPHLLVDVCWIGASMGVAVAGLRAIGMPLRWALGALLWTPFAQGLYVGNVSIPVFGMFAFAPWIGSGVVVAAVFKLYSGIGALWLVQERYVRSIAVAVALVLGLTLVTLPLTGVTQWIDWVHGLDWYSRSQPLLPGSLYGIGLPRYVPEWVGVALGLLAIAAALQVRGHEALGRLGVATIVASPSLFAHGFLVAIPAMLRLRPAVLWLVVGMMAVAPGIGWWPAIGIVVASWWLALLRRTPGVEAAADLHPLGARRAVWPNAPIRPRDEDLLRTMPGGSASSSGT